MTTPTLDNGVIALGTVKKPEKIVLNNNLFTKKLPGTGSGSTIALDIMGKVRTIQITGVKTGTEAALKTWAQGIDSWANSSIMERKTYKSSLNISYSVRCDIFEYNIYHNRCEYRMVFIEGGIV